MAFQLSPGVQVTEKDLTSVVPAVGTSIGGTAGDFIWGPANQVVTISSENELVSRFGLPPIVGTLNRTWFAAASFLAYTNTLKVVRSISSTALNAGATAGVLIENENDYINNHLDGSGSNGIWAAKYPGALGNSLKVSFADSSTFDSNSVASAAVSSGGSGYTEAPTVTFDAAPAGGITATGTATITGDAVSAITITNPGNGYTSPPSITITSSSGSGAIATVTMATDWEYAGQFDYAPLTTAAITASGGSNDEMHIIVIDEDGLFTGTAGTILEKFAGVSKCSGAKDSVGRSNYYKNVINDRSQYIWWTDHPASATTWGNADATIAFDSNQTSAEATVSLTLGVTGVSTSGERQTAFGLFANDELVDVNLIFVGDADALTGKYVIDSIAEVRKDCMVFVSPAAASAVNNTGSEATAIVAEIASYTRSSFAVMDSGWKYMYNRYYDSYVWVPCNGDVAGLCASTDDIADPWFSPAGYNRGAIKNAVRLAYSPNKSERDTLYKAGVNPIVGFPGSGIVLFGDKTMLEKPSAFDRINVRRLFITLEKAIATAAKFQLFEFNDAFTRAQFKNLVEPFLRDVQGRRGIYDFRVVCDETNNTGQVIDSNQFVSDIFIQPAKSINFIQLNFVATRTGIAFEEVGA